VSLVTVLNIIYAFSYLTKYRLDMKSNLLIRTRLRNFTGN